MKGNPKRGTGLATVSTTVIERTSRWVCDRSNFSNWQLKVQYKKITKKLSLESRKRINYPDFCAGWAVALEPGTMFWNIREIREGLCSAYHIGYPCQKTITQNCSKTRCVILAWVSFITLFLINFTLIRHFHTGYPTSVHALIGGPTQEGWSCGFSQVTAKD